MKTIGVCDLFGAHNHTINGDNFGFALNVCMTPCTGGPKLYMEQDEDLKLAGHF